MILLILAYWLILCAIAMVLLPYLETMQDEKQEGRTP